MKTKKNVYEVFYIERKMYHEYGLRVIWVWFEKIGSLGQLGFARNEASRCSSEPNFYYDIVDSIWKREFRDFIV